MRKGHIVLSPFTDLSGIKTKPALVLAEDVDFVIVSFITSQVSWSAESDLLVEPDDENGLKKRSVVRLKKLTIDRKKSCSREIGKSK